MAIGNMHKKLWQRLRVLFRRYPRGKTDRQTNTHIHTYSLQYFAITHEGKVILRLSLSPTQSVFNYVIC